MEETDDTTQKTRQSLRKARRATSSMVGYGFIAFTIIVAIILLVVYFL